MAASHDVEAGRWPALESQLLYQIADWFPRMEVRRRFTRFLRGMLAKLSRNRRWSIAEHDGEPSPHGMQHLLNRARWAPEVSSRIGTSPSLSAASSTAQPFLLSDCRPTRPLRLFRDHHDAALAHHLLQPVVEVLIPIYVHLERSEPHEEGK